jgi:hypothetical protein
MCLGLPDNCPRANRRSLSAAPAATRSRCAKRSSSAASSADCFWQLLELMLSHQHGCGWPPKLGVRRPPYAASRETIDDQGRPSYGSTATAASIPQKVVHRRRGAFEFCARLRDGRRGGADGGNQRLLSFVQRGLGGIQSRKRGPLIHGDDGKENLRGREALPGSGRRRTSRPVRLSAETRVRSTHPCRTSSNHRRASR